MTVTGLVGWLMLGADEAGVAHMSHICSLTAQRLYVCPYIEQARADFFLRLWGAFPQADGTCRLCKHYSRHNNGPQVIYFLRYLMCLTHTVLLGNLVNSLELSVICLNCSYCIQWKVNNAKTYAVACGWVTNMSQATTSRPTTQVNFTMKVW